MILSDTHVHTQFSSDSQEPMENMVKRGIELGLKEIYFTDHMDLDFPKQYKYDFLFDIHAQQAGISRLDKKYSEITLYRGIELGLQPHLAKQADQLLSEKIDHLLVHQNKKLLEIQEMQIQYLENIENQILHTKDKKENKEEE